MKGKNIPCLWIAPDGTAVWFPSRNDCARALEVNVFSVVAAMTRGTRCASGYIIRDDGRPSVTTFTPELKAQAIIERGRGRCGRILEERNARFREYAKAAVEAEDRSAAAEIWAERETVLEGYRRLRREQLTKVAPTDFVPENWRTQAPSQRIIQMEYNTYRRSKIEKKERVRIARRKRLLRVDCTVGYYTQGDNPTICPCCGKLILGTDVKRQKHILGELKKVFDEGREFARYPGGIIRVSKEKTGHKMDSMYM